jgi:hypothetical protein
MAPSCARIRRARPAWISAAACRDTALEIKADPQLAERNALNMGDASGESRTLRTDRRRPRHERAMHMRKLWTIVLILGMMAAGTTSVSAQASSDQDIPPLRAQAIRGIEHTIEAPALSPPDMEHRQHELEKWMDDFSEWKKWSERWGNRREPGWFTGSRDRRQRPDPPAWLFEWCRDLGDQGDEIDEPCTLLTEWATDFPTAQAANARAAGTSAAEDGAKTIWWEHVHLDAGWPALQSGVSLYGVIGMHATTSVRGRFQIFVAPGMMLLNVPTSDGKRAWKLATSYGIAYRLGQIAFPGNRQALLHLNLAKAWLLSAGPDVPTRSTDFVGLSLTFKKTP